MASDKPVVHDELPGRLAKAYDQMLERAGAEASRPEGLGKEYGLSDKGYRLSEAQAQAICMQTKDFERAYRAFAAKEKPVFEGN